jgi:guanylate kinase
MTPKEKALELREKCDGYVCYAEVAVDEILDALDQSLIDADLEYWQQVKQEIEKL